MFLQGWIWHQWKRNEENCRSEIEFHFELDTTTTTDFPFSVLRLLTFGCWQMHSVNWYNSAWYGLNHTPIAEAKHLLILRIPKPKRKRKKISVKNSECNSESIKHLNWFRVEWTQFVCFFFSLAFVCYGFIFVLTREWYRSLTRKQTHKHTLRMVRVVRVDTLVKKHCSKKLVWAKRRPRRRQCVVFNSNFFCHFARRLMCAVQSVKCFKFFFCAWHSVKWRISKMTA